MPDEQRIRNLLKAVTDYSYTVEVKNGQPVNAIHSAGCIAVTGYSPEEYEADQYLWFNMVHEEDRDAVLKQANQVLAGESPPSLEHRIIHKDGTVRWLKNTPVPRFNKKDHLIAYDSLVSNITERKLAEEKIQIINRALRTLNACNETLSRSQDEKEFLQKICQILLQIGGYHFVWVGYVEQDKIKAIRPVEWAGTKAEYLKKLEFTFDDTPNGCGPAGVAIKTGKTAVCKNVLTDPRYASWRDAAIKHGYASAIALPLKKRRTFGVLNIYAADINAFSDEEIELLERLGNNLAYGIAAFRLQKEKMLAEGALQQKTAQFEAIFKAMPDAVIFTDAHSRIVLANPAVGSVFGISQADLYGSHIKLLFSDEEDYQKQGEQHFNLNSGKRIKPNEINFRRLDNTVFPGDTVTVEVKDYEENELGFLVIIRDITKRKAAEIQQQNLQTQLIQAQKMESVGRLAGGIAHDFNNILTVIQSYCSLALEELPDGSTVKADLNIVRDSAKKASILTRQLLAFSRKQLLEIKVTNLSELVTNMAKMLTRMLGEDIKLKLETSKSLKNVFADPGQIEQVLMNLAVNARDAMFDGGSLTIETSNIQIDPDAAHNYFGLVPGSYVMLSVSDSGEGMPLDVQKKIFEPFFTTKQLGKGTGLGLSTVYGIIKQHGGYIYVFSELGQGTTFKIFLPVAEGKPEKIEQQVSQDKPKGSETLLVVEDDKSIRLLISKMLEQLGYKLLVASSGEEALDISASYEGDIDLLLTDVIMPGMNGRVMADRLQALRPAIKVIYMSGYTDDAIAHHGVRDPSVIFIQKPLTPHKLSNKIRVVLDAK